MEQRLKKDLFCEDYDKTLRPNGKNTTTIGFNIYLHTLSLEEHNEELNINAWIGLVIWDIFLIFILALLQSQFYHYSPGVMIK